MRVIFAGTGTFAVPSLAALLDWCKSTDNELISVYTQADRPCGRGRILSKSPVKQYAMMHQLGIEQPVSLKKGAFQVVSQLQPDLIVVADYGLILPSAVLKIPSFGCINVHASLLPKWRGAAPIQRALLAGDEVTGITLMQMDKGLDSGAILCQCKETIAKDDNTASLEAKLAILGARALVEIMPRVQGRELRPYAQPVEGVCYAHKLSKEEALIDWSLSAVALCRQIRAFNPWPVSFTWLNGKRIRVWKAKVCNGVDGVCVSGGGTRSRGLPGCVVELGRDGIIVATGEGELKLCALQQEGGRCLSVRDLLNGGLSFVRVGMRFGGGE